MDNSLIYMDSIIANNSVVRTFSIDVDGSELVWHRDDANRYIKVISGSGWFFQMDNELPVELKTNDEFFVPKEFFHRIFKKGNTDLILLITNK